MCRVFSFFLKDYISDAPDLNQVIHDIKLDSAAATIDVKGRTRANTARHSSTYRSSTSLGSDLSERLLLQ